METLRDWKAPWALFLCGALWDGGGNSIIEAR